MTEISKTSDKLQMMTEIQQAYLKQILSTLPTPKKQFLKAALNTAVFWVLTLVGFCILWFICSLLVNTFTKQDIGINSDYARHIFPATIVLSFIFSLNSTRKWLNNSNKLYHLITADLTTNQILTETYNIIAVKRFKEPQHGGLVYFLKLPEDKVRVIYDYESQNNDSDSGALLTIKSQLTIATTLHSNIVVTNQFSGSLFTDINDFELTLPPAQWPMSDTWQHVEWETLETIYSYAKD